MPRAFRKVSICTCLISGGGGGGVHAGYLSFMLGEGGGGGGAKAQVKQHAATRKIRPREML